MTRVLSEQAGSVLALDVSPEMIERARAYNPLLSTSTDRQPTAAF